MSGLEYIGDSDVGVATKTEDDDTVDVGASELIDVDLELELLLGDNPTPAPAPKSVSDNVALWEKRRQGFCDIAGALKIGKPVHADQFKVVVGYLYALHNIKNLHARLK